MEVEVLGSKEAIKAQKKAQAKFTKKGSVMGIVSAITFGFYSAVLGVALAMGPFTDEASLLVAPLVGAAMNDSLAALWLLIYNTIQGRSREIWRSLKTLPGLIVCLAALLGGPIANAAYLLAIQFSGPAYAIPISALCPVVGALLARIFLKQKVTKRVMLGIVMCVTGAVIIGYTPPEGGSMPYFVLGLICAFVAAFGWGAEGTLSAFGTALIDPKVAINIRQATSGIVFIVVVVPIVGGLTMFGKAMVSPAPLVIIAVAALAAAVSFLTWYKANSMCGVAQGMALNSTYVLWGIIFSYFLGQAEMTTTLIVGAILVTLGAMLVAIDPREMFSKKEA
ncbi:DMT family transporter [Clostridium tarantellae]|uniref:EamA family transporter n=1 Tax=Clostridium tarantellae TaxID=39493 RepID=A0A6I1MKY3_9CLOT|nr:DMT family transporter [Clostridium tarantellae]MPQ43634.1 EamA family transporter [Clostridium tarantellae]